LPTPIDGCISPRIDIGTNTLGCTPSVVPSNPRGATPITVIDFPLMTIAFPMMAGSLPSCEAQNP